VSDENGDVKIITKWFTITGKKMAELITVLSLVVLAVLTYVVWELKTEVAIQSDQHNAGMKIVAAAISDSAVSQREFMCIISREQEDRRRALETGECRRAARLGTRQP
jgi:hypothetical protein